MIEIELSLEELTEYLKNAKIIPEKRYFSETLGEHFTPEYIIIEKDDKEIKLLKDNMEKGIKLTKEIKVLAKKISQNFDMKLVAQYHQKVILRSYCFQISSMEHCHRLFVKRSKEEKRISNYCIQNMDIIEEYCRKNNIMIL